MECDHLKYLVTNFSEPVTAIVLLYMPSVHGVHNIVTLVHMQKG
jgi:hypothetical protein